MEKLTAAELVIIVHILRWRHDRSYLCRFWFLRHPNQSNENQRSTQVPKDQATWLSRNAYAFGQKAPNKKDRQFLYPKNKRCCAPTR